MNVQFKNARILKTNPDHSFEILDGELWVKGNEICYIGDGKDTERVTDNAPIAWENPIDCQGNLLIPGFKNVCLQLLSHLPTAAGCAGAQAYCGWV